MNINDAVWYPCQYQIQKEIELGLQIDNSAWLQVYENVERPLWSMLMNVNRSIDRAIALIELDNGEQDNV